MHPTPRHEHAFKYARSSIFSGLASFKELERRIELLPTEMERGAAFEVFVEAYLNVSEMAQTEEVWVVGKVPAEIRDQLNLPSRDYGYDGVFRTKVGELVAYQAKFRSKRAALSYAELSTFFGISESADARIVLTNSIAIAAVAVSRIAFQSTRGGDFDRLDALQLETINQWIAGFPSTPQPREPRQHQVAALADIRRELIYHDRVTIVMACGTGKTLVGLWAAEDKDPKRVLVLLPSLNLLRQTLHEWARWTSWGGRFRYLCVCSDPKVGSDMDQIDVRPEDADFPVRTDPSVVRKFLASGGDGSVSVVFCTYQSAHVIGNAVSELAPFDMGIFDEAHKTTGREGARFSFALNDANLPIHKRIFFTATPRHFNIRKRDRDGEFTVVSMDDVALYGRVAHRLTFSQAVHQKLIVPYKIVISIVDSQTIDNETIEQSEVAIEGDQIRAKWVANQLAIQRAVEQYDVKRIITFHSRVSAAAAFTSHNSEGIGGFLPSFHCFHVSGSQPTAERDEKMREFARVPRGIVSNARCLTEGVDIPSVDMVAFMNPKRSRVDIVQAVGRAMRTSGDGKNCGYVLVPLFLDLRQGESIAQAIQRSDYREIADVLNAMRETDEKLGDLIEELSIEKGKTGGFDESRLRNLVEVLGPQIELEALSKAIRTTLVDELGSSWNERYGQLMAYKEVYGTCDIPVSWPEWQVLSNWCNSQKTAFTAKTLAHERLNKLEAIGFSWAVQRKSWDVVDDNYLGRLTTTILAG
jgi:predicted helicase